jgi:hypothetical protein
MFDIETLPSAWKGHRQFANWLSKTLAPKVTVDLGLGVLSQNKEFINLINTTFK